MWEFIVIVICLFTNAVLAATELAFVSISKSRLKKLAREGKKGAADILELRENPEKALSVLQVGITFVGIIAAAVGGVGADEWLTPILMRSWGVSQFLGSMLTILIFVIPYTFINVLFSELLPKSVALRNPKWMLLHTRKWMIFFGTLFAPVVYLLEKSTKWCLRTFFFWIKYDHEPEESFSVGKMLRPYMVNLANIETKRIKDVMLPWTETVTISSVANTEEVKRIMVDTGHTRLPVLEEGKPIGILHSKEFMTHLEKKDPNWSHLIHPLIKFSPEDSLIEALKILQKSRYQMSLVFSDSKPIGMVTIEDILEEVVGEIYDEDDPSIHIVNEE